MTTPTTPREELQRQIEIGRQITDIMQDVAVFSSGWQPEFGIDPNEYEMSKWVDLIETILLQERKALREQIENISGQYLLDKDGEEYGDELISKDKVLNALQKGKR